MPVRYEFEKELNRLHKDIVKMGSFIEESMNDTIEALKKVNPEIAQHVILNDDLIDEMEKKIARECIITIARQQPIATDLRDIASILKISSNLERIADHCEDIGEYVVKISRLSNAKIQPDLLVMAESVSKMVSDVIDAYVRKDFESAKNIIAQDDIVDKMYLDFTEKIMTEVEANNTYVREGTHNLFISKYLERIADHTTDIAKWTIYFLTGEIQ